MKNKKTEPAKLQPAAGGDKLILSPSLRVEEEALSAAEPATPMWEMISLEDRIAELEAAVLRSEGEWEPDGSEVKQDDPVIAPLTVDLDAVRHGIGAPDRAEQPVAETAPHDAARAEEQPDTGAGGDVPAPVTSGAPQDTAAEAVADDTHTSAEGPAAPALAAIDDAVADTIAHIIEAEAPLALVSGDDAGPDADETGDQPAAASPPPLSAAAPVAPQPETPDASPAPPDAQTPVSSGFVFAPVGRLSLDRGQGAAPAPAQDQAKTPPVDGPDPVPADPAPADQITGEQTPPPAEDAPAQAAPGPAEPTLPEPDPATMRSVLAGVPLRPTGEHSSGVPFPPAPKPAPEPDAPAVAAAERVLSATGGSVDAQALADLIRDVVREELQGELGERITRNVRKLVRREINRALASRDLE